MDAALTQAFIPKPHARNLHLPFGRGYVLIKPIRLSLHALAVYERYGTFELRGGSARRSGALE